MVDVLSIAPMFWISGIIWGPGMFGIIGMFMGGGKE